MSTSGGGTVQTITNSDGTISVTHPSGPSTDIDLTGVLPSNDPGAGPAFFVSTSGAVRGAVFSNTGGGNVWLTPTYGSKNNAVEVNASGLTVYGSTGVAVGVLTSTGGFTAGDVVAEPFGTDTGGVAGGGGIGSQAFTSGVAFTPLATSDCLLYVDVTLAGTLTFTMGPAVGNENTIYSATAVVAAPIGCVRVPKNWKVVITLVTATATLTKQAC